MAVDMWRYNDLISNRLNFQKFTKMPLKAFIFKLKSILRNQLNKCLMEKVIHFLKAIHTRIPSVN